MRRPVLLLVLVLGLVAALWRWQPASDVPGTGPAASGSDTGYVARAAILTDTGDDGRPRYRLRADSISQAHPGGDVQLEQPRLDYEGSTRWQLSASTGTLPEDASRVQLVGGVEARAEQPHEPPLRIRTELLDIDMLARRAETPAPVSIELGSSHLEAVGLHADMKADSLRLESRVHGEYTH
jgi:LPS export ABC transporter protein LptC